MNIVSIQDLCKDYETGFWKKRKVRALDIDYCGRLASRRAALRSGLPFALGRAHPARAREMPRERAEPGDRFGL